MRSLLSLLTFVGVCLAPTYSHAAASRLNAKIADEDLNLKRTHEAWPAPETMAEQLASKDDAVRLRAALLFGLSDQQAHVFTNGSLTVRQVIRPDLVKLNYVALGTGRDLQAVVAFQAGQMVYAAIAVPAKAGWVRIAYCDIWSRYDGGDALAEDVGLRLAPSDTTVSPLAFELILRNSGGGSGIYDQQEAHYRVYKGELRNVFSFRSAKRSSPTPPPNGVFTTFYERSWFTGATEGNKYGYVLVDERGSSTNMHQPPITYLEKLEVRYLHLFRCSFYMWNDASFTYKLVSDSPEACRAIKGR